MFGNKTKDIIKKTDGIILKSQLNKELLKIEPNIANFEIEKAVSLGEANAILGVIPDILASNTLSNAYRVVMPEGAVGNLMQYKTGLQGTPLVDPITNKITGHAGLASLNPAAIALAAFTAASFVTGQYFMAEIRKELSELKKGLKRVEGMLEDKIISEVQSAISFIEYAEMNLNEILFVNVHKIATLTNVQSSTNLLLQNSIYYERQVNRILVDIMDSAKISQIDQNYKKMEETLKYWCACTYGFYYGKIIEIKLSENYDEVYLKKTRNELKDRSLLFNNTIVKFINDLYSNLDKSQVSQRSVLENIIGFFAELFGNDYETKGEIKIDHIKSKGINLQNELDKKYQELCRIPDGITRILELNKGFSYVVQNNKVYMITKNAKNDM